MRWFIPFFIGASCYVLRDKIPYRWWLCVSAFIISLISWYYVPQGRFIHYTLLPYIVLYLGLKTPAISGFLKGNDISYGVYIYAFPIQQLYMHVIGKDYGLLGFTLACTVLSFACGYLSWRYVERPALRLKKKLPGRRTHTPAHSVNSDTSAYRACNSGH